MAPEVPGGCLAGLAGCGQARLTYVNTRLVRRVWAPQRPELGSRPGEVPGSGGTRGGHGYGPRATGVEAFGTEIAEEPREGLSQLSGPRPGGPCPLGPFLSRFTSCWWPHFTLTGLRRGGSRLRTTVTRIRLEEGFCNIVFTVWICIL